MKKYFATLDGDLGGIDHYIGFFAKDDADAQEFADEKAEAHYSEYDYPFSVDEETGEDGDPLFYADVEEWDDEKHEEYLGQGCFTSYFKDTRNG